MAPPDLAGFNLADGANLAGAVSTSANLSGANLKGADLRAANLTYSDLKGADLSAANLTAGRMAGAHLAGANLWRELDRCRLEGRRRTDPRPIG